jgi:pimeloyl-ACP methyl ester carboxylesterase
MAMHLGGSTRTVVLLLVLSVVAGLSASAWAQVPQKKAPVPPQKTPTAPGKTPVAPGQKTPVAPGGKASVAPPKTPAPPQKKGSKLPEPEEISLPTKDDLTIKATYYPGTAKKEAVPVILVHGFEGQRGDMHGLALHLQGLGHAAIAPDLRGHGQSKTQHGVTLDPEKMNRAALEGAVWDIQACKKFLLDKNNAGELNIEQLCVVGAEYGALLAFRWAAIDLTTPDLPAYKLGKDVKALVLLSIPPSFKGITIREAIAPLQAAVPPVSVLFVAGAEDSKATAEAKKLMNTLEARRSKAAEDKDLFLVQPETNLSGTKLLGNSLDIKNNIGVFIEKRLVNRQADFPWQKRETPGQ